MASSNANPSKGAPGKGPGRTGFPTAAAIAVACAAAVLLGWHFWKKAPGGGSGMPPSVFREALEVHPRKKPEAKAGRAPLSGVPGASGLQNSPPPQTRPGALPPISAVLVDDSGTLDPFFAALWHLEHGKSGAGAPASAAGGSEPTHAGEKAAVPNGAPGAKGQPSTVGTAAMEGPPGQVGGGEVVTILHYGDSPTTADLITGDARAMLQTRFGDAGHGFNLPAKPWAWYGHRDVTISDHGWKPLTAMGNMREGAYGLGGATMVGEPGAKSTLRLADASQTAVELSYLDEPDGGSFSVSADGAALQMISTKGSADTPAFMTVKLPTGTKDVGIEVTSGTVKLLGVDFRKGETGVLYDSMGLNGASTTVMSRGFGKAAWGAELQHAHPALVIINYGTNESGDGKFVTKSYENELRLAVAKVRSALPAVPILVMSPMDRGERAGLNGIQTMATIPQLVDIQKRVAADLHCGFFDTFDAMGGDGTMANWYNGKPRLVSADLIHPTPQGAKIVATELVNNLNLGYDRWKWLHGVEVAPAGAVATPVGRAGPAQSPEGRAAPSGVGSHSATGGEAKPAKRTSGPEQDKPKPPQDRAPKEGAPQPLRLKTPDGKTPDTRD